jgi:hypothetical protein
MKTKEQILERLNAITSSYSFLKVISKICYRDFCGTVEELASQNLFDHLNYNEVFFLIGLWVKNVKIGQELNDDEIETIFKEVYPLMDDLHTCLFKEGPRIDPTNTQSTHDFFNNGAYFKEAIFYAGTGAYDYQYVKWSPDKYQYDEDWLLQNKKFDLNKVYGFYDLIHKRLQYKLNANIERNFNKIDIDILVDSFCLSEQEITGNADIYKSLTDCLTLNLEENLFNKDFNDIGDFNIIAEKPLLKLPNGKFFLPTSFSVSLALYESPFYWMIADKSYSNTCQKNRGKAAEDITFKIVNSIFDAKSIFKGVTIRQNKVTTITDIDVLAINQYQALIFQVKSKKLTSLSKKGDIISINSDFQKAVKDAYEQGLICEKCLINDDKYIFSLSDGKDLKFEKKITECYIVTIVLDDYPAITHQTNILIGETMGHMPVAVNIFDLEVIARYLNTPAKFIDYISKRIKYNEFYKSASELSYLGFHLKKGLHKPKNQDLVMLDETWARGMDSKYYPEISNLKKVDFTGNLKLGRNEKCYCGSEKKYKHCHGKE